MAVPAPAPADGDDPINILLQPFDPVPAQKTADGEDIFWKMVTGEIETSVKAAQEMQRREDLERERIASIEANKALMMGGADGEVCYESLVRPSKSVARGEFPLMKLSASTLMPPRATPLPDKPVPRVATVPPKPPPKEVPKPPATIEHKLDEITSGLLKNSNLHIHRTRHDPTNLFWSMKKEEE